MLRNYHTHYLQYIYNALKNIVFHRTAQGLKILPHPQLLTHMWITGIVKRMPGNVTLCVRCWLLASK